MFSKELLELDKNTVQYMIDEMQDELDAKQETITAQQELLEQQLQEIDALKKKLAESSK